MGSGPKRGLKKCCRHGKVGAGARGPRTTWLCHRPNLHPLATAAMQLGGRYTLDLPLALNPNPKPNPTPAHLHSSATAAMQLGGK